jgi:isoquinoline 1-oxidoreductase beta subunit
LRSLRLSRRSFLASAGALSVAVAFGGSECAEAGDAGTRGALDANAWVTIGADGTITILSAPAEMGQGIMTGLPVCLAEELDADWSRVRVRQSPGLPRLYGNPMLRMEMSTHGDYSVQGYFEKMRLVGAQTRKVLLLNAARILAVDAKSLATEPGIVVHAPSGRRLGYGEIAAQARLPDPLPEVTTADLKPASQWRLIGRSVPRVDLPSKVDGSAVYGIDVQQPGMLYAAVAYPPVPHERPVTVDDAPARAVAGVVEVVRLPNGVGVIAVSVEAALQAKDRLAVEWSTDSRARGYDSRKIVGEYAAIAADTGRQGVTMTARGDVAAALGGASRVVSRDYFCDHVAHAQMEPLNATARVDGDRIEVWASTQSPSMVLPAVAEALGTTEDKVTLHSTLLGGAFGRTSEDPDAIREAVLLAAAVPGRPVKLIRSRSDDFMTDKFRPIVAQHLDAAVDATGNIVGLRHRIVCPSAWARYKPKLYELLQGKDIVVGLAEVAYGWPDHAVDYVRVESGWDIGPWRGISVGYTAFAVEALVDECAAACGRDPLQYRLDHLAADERALGVVRAVAENAGWDRPRAKGRALGLAFSRMSKSYAAGVAEVSVDAASGEIRLHEMWLVLDAGIVVHPDAVVAQMEGSVVMGLGAALHEQVNVVAGELQESQFGAYRPPRMSQVPDAVHVSLLPSAHAPGGVGEIGVTVVAPAIANALARLTGRRLRHLPMSPERVARAMN